MDIRLCRLLFDFGHSIFLQYNRHSFGHFLLIVIGIGRCSVGVIYSSCHCRAYAHIVITSHILYASAHSVSSEMLKDLKRGEMTKMMCHWAMRKRGKVDWSETKDDVFDDALLDI